MPALGCSVSLCLNFFFFFQVCKLLKVNLPFPPGANSGVNSTLDKSSCAVIERAQDNSYFFFLAFALSPCLFGGSSCGAGGPRLRCRCWLSGVLHLGRWHCGWFALALAVGTWRYTGSKWWPLESQLKDVGSHPATKSCSLPASKAVGNVASMSHAVPQPGPRMDDCKAWAYFGLKDSIVAGTFSKPLFFAE